MGQPLMLAHFCTDLLLLFLLSVGERKSETEKTGSDQSRSHTYDAANRLTARARSDGKA